MSCPELCGQVQPYSVMYSNVSMANDYALLKFNFWFFSTICKLVPCLMLIVMTVLLTLKLLQFERKSRLLASKCQKGSSHLTILENMGFTD